MIYIYIEGFGCEILEVTMGRTYTWVGETRHILSLEEGKGEILGKR